MSALSTLLLVQSDPTLRAGISFGFEREGIEVVTAERDDAKLSDALARRKPQLVVAGSNGEEEAIETLARVKRALSSANLDAPILYVGNGVRRDRALSEGATEVIDRPGFVRDIVTLGRLVTSRKATEPKTLIGQLRDYFGLFYLLRAVSATGKRCVLTLVRGLRRGEIRFYDGEVTSASVGVLHGLAALHQLLLWADASFELRPEDVVRRRQIPLRPDEVIADAERFLIEVKSEAGELSPAHVYEPNPDADAESLASVPRSIGSVLRLFDGSRKVADVIEDSPHRMFDTLRIANKLVEGALIRHRDVQGQGKVGRTALSIEEWLTGKDAVSSAPIYAGAAKSEPIGPKLGVPASPPRKKKRKKRKSKRRSAQREPVALPSAPVRIDWDDVIPKRMSTETGTVSQLVPSASRSGEIGVVNLSSATSSDGSHADQPSVLVSATASVPEADAPRPAREGVSESTDSEMVAKRFVAKIESRETSGELSSLAELDGQAAPDTADTADTADTERVARSASGEIGESPRKAVVVNFGTALGAGTLEGAAEPSVLVDDPIDSDSPASPARVPDSVVVDSAIAEESSSWEAVKAQAEAEEEAWMVAEANARKAEAEAELEAKGEAEVEAEAKIKKAAKLEARAKAGAEAKAKAAERAGAKAKVKAEKAEAKAKAAEKFEAEAKARAEKSEAEAKAKAEKSEAEAKAKAGAKAAAEEKTKAEVAAKAAKAKAKTELEAAKLKERAARKAEKKAKKNRKSKVKGTTPKKRAKEPAVSAKEAGSSAAGSDVEAKASRGALEPADDKLPDLAIQSADPAIEKLAVDAAKTSEEISAFSAAEEAFFRAGQKLANVPAPPVEDFDDLDDGFDVPKTFWQRLRRRPGDTDRKPDK